MGTSNESRKKAQSGQDAYTRIDDISEEVTKSRASFTGLITPAPLKLSVETWASFKGRNERLRAWHSKCLELLSASIYGEISPAIAAALLDHLPPHVGWVHHRRLPLKAVGTPHFFRTDQAANGTVLEVQCPGSLWGVHEIISEFYRDMGFVPVAHAAPLSDLFIQSLRKSLNAEPVVHHLLDNSSHPAGERFFIQRARAGATYFGFDAVRPQDCNFVRSHDFLTLLIENFAGERLQKLIEGSSVYDLPPVALFDQKLLLAFPFWDETREHFDDLTRNMFPYTTVLTPNGMRLSDGEWVTLDQLANLPRNSRAYFLKYAGSDVARNWGSRAVYHLGKLSSAACSMRLKEATERFDSGERWILQQECPSREDVSFIMRNGDISSTSAHSKHSVFYGPSGPMGVLSMFEQFYKVHGSAETITTVALPPMSPLTKEVTSW